MTDFPKSYDPREAERTWYALWEQNGLFRPEAVPGGEPYSIVIPPPNITGSLHMGHALNITLQDVLIRWRRMQGRRALWVPGTDHAGIATQNVVERQLSSEGTDRHALGRDAFIQRVWQWKEEYGGRIIHQLKKLGASCDWSRQRFTLDEGLSRAVREVFVRLYEDNLIYRDTRLINWCPRCRTALSDLEVEHEEIKGALTHITYPFLDGRGAITVATTRPETMLGDTAVAVHPRDERYRKYIGKTVELPLTGRKIPVIADEQVDPAFGTGAVKITPAHDFNDEAAARRQSPPLPAIVVIGEDGRMTDNAGLKYKGLDRYECRNRVVEDLEKEGLIVKEEEHAHAAGRCYRCKTVIEPFSTPQWYVRVGPLAAEAIEAVRSGRIRIIPEGWANSYFSWMENIRDWCITRQIWWGHRVPVWYCDACGETVVSRDDPAECPKCRGALRQDPDVLDTWFSSALWPFSTLGWPDETPDLGAFYPTSVLVTAFDILFFWVARMIMMGLKFMDEVPFRDVFIHAIVRDAEGQKMSKSKGNVIDPLLLIDKYGACAFRFALAAFAAQGRDIKFSEERVEGYRHFINKLWNAARFVLMNLEEGSEPPSMTELRRRMLSPNEGGGRSLAARWILSRLAATTEEVNAALEDHRFNDAAGAAYGFAWHEFCDWYIEMAKTEMSDETRAAETRECLLYVLEAVLRMLHPFMPFVSEDIWQRLPLGKDASSVSLAPFPAGFPRDLETEAEAAPVLDAITGIRNIRGEMNIPPANKVRVFIRTNSDKAAATLSANLSYVEGLARASVEQAGIDVVLPDGSSTSVTPTSMVAVSLAGSLDVGAELARLGKEKKKVEESLAFTAAKLRNEVFLSRAPKDVVEKERKKHGEILQKRDKLMDTIKRLQGLEA